MSCMPGSPNLNSSRDRGQVAVQLVSCGVLLPGLVQDCTGDISTLEGTPLKLVDKFTYLGSSVESTEKDIETRLTKAWTAINRLSTIWKSDLTDKITQFLPGSGHIDTAIWMHYMDANKTAGEETRWQLHKNAACNPEQEKLVINNI